MAPNATVPSAPVLLEWMRVHGRRLGELMAAEGEYADDRTPVSDAAIRAHLRFIAEALAANAEPEHRPAFGDLAVHLPDRIDERHELLEEALDRVAGAVALEVNLQFGDAGADDPTVQKVVERRMRVIAWHRFFLDLLDETLGTANAPAAIAWMSDHQGRLGDLIFATDRGAKEAVRAREGLLGLEDIVRVNQIGQAAMLQAYSRFLVEAIAAADR